MWRALAFVICALPAQAQTADPMRIADCLQTDRALEAVADRAFARKGNIRLDAEGWCLAENVSLDVDSNVTLEVASLRWRVSGMDRALQGLPPTALSIMAEGVRSAPQTGDPVIDYLMDLQQSTGNITATFDAGWSAESLVLRLNRAEIRFSEDDHIALRGLVTDIDLSDESKIYTSLGQARLTDLTVDIETNGMFENYFAMALGTLLLHGAEDPEAEVENLKAQALQVVSDLPEANFDAASIAALRQILRDMPRPRGFLRVRLQSGDGLGSLRFFALGNAIRGAGVDGLWPLLPDLSVAVSYPDQPE